MSIAAPKTAVARRRMELPNGRWLPLDGRPLVMGVLNITPDSFSDGGRYLDPDRAVDHALQMIRDGADVVDLGAESTRPGGGVYGSGADEVSARNELDRLLPVLERLRELTEVPLSVDTRKAEVAKCALAGGADLVNDISALADPRMGEVVAAGEAPIILMHSRGELDTMQRGIHFTNVVEEVRTELGQRVERALECGIPSSRILLDPGIGFGKTVEQNLELLRHLERLTELGCPIVLGASRKSFIGAITDRANGQRLGGSLAAAVWGAFRGADILRVHDVSETVQFFELWSAFEDSAEPSWA